MKAQEYFVVFGGRIMITFEMIGRRIKLRREFLKMSQKDMALLLEEKGLKLSRETISKIENGSRATNAIEIKAIGEMIGISAEELMQENKEKDLVDLFRSRGKELSQNTIEGIVEIQEFFKGIIVQKKINSGEIKIKRFESSWR